MTSVFAALENKIVVRVNCDATDSFDSVWRKVIDELHILAALRTDDRAEPLRAAVEAAENELADVDQMRANDVRKLLRMVSDALDCMVFIDEFERLKDPRSTASFAETIKILSDESVSATVVLVGVGDNLEELLSEHGSIERALAQIHMPRMSRDELADIVQGGLEMLDMKIEDRALSTIVNISRGLPHFTHLIAQSAARAAIDEGEKEITSEHVSTAITKLSVRTQETVLNAYGVATTSKRDTIYPQVLLACALAPSDQQGFFSAADVVEPLSEVMGRPYPIPSFSRHLHALSETTRGPALQRRGTEHRYRFRFMNPLLQPYVLMKGIAEGSIEDGQLERFPSGTGPEDGS
jgi:Cdc6-like AAA superfamily ATPase